jgi:hypothetical protein
MAGDAGYPQEDDVEYMGPEDRRRFLLRVAEVYRQTGLPVSMADIRLEISSTPEYMAAFAEKLRAAGDIDLTTAGGELGVIPLREAEPYGPPRA